MAEIDTGLDLYEINKQIMIQKTPIQDEMIHREISGIADWFSYEKSRYFMLLCHERRDYTIFNFLGNKAKKVYEASQELLEVLQSRGEILDIEYEAGAYLIWLKINDEAFLYYLFSYDAGVIEV